MGGARIREAHGRPRLPLTVLDTPRGDQAARGVLERTATRPPGGRTGRGGRPHRAHRVQDCLPAARPRAHDRPGRPGRGRRGDGGAALRRTLGRAGRGPAHVLRLRLLGVEARSTSLPGRDRGSSSASTSARRARAPHGSCHVRRVPERRPRRALERQALCAAPRGAVRRGVSFREFRTPGELEELMRDTEAVQVKTYHTAWAPASRAPSSRSASASWRPSGVVPRFRALPRRHAERVLARDCLSEGFLHGPDGLRSGASRSSSRHVRTREDGRRALRRG